MSRTAPLTSKHCTLYIYSTNVGTEYFKHALYSSFFLSLQNAVCFIMLTCLVPVFFTFYIQGVLKLKKIIPAPKGLNPQPPFSVRHWCYLEVQRKVYEWKVQMLTARTFTIKNRRVGIPRAIHSSKISCW